jgi:hypothetical protein
MNGDALVRSSIQPTRSTGASFALSTSGETPSPPGAPFVRSPGLGGLRSADGSGSFGISSAAPPSSDAAGRGTPRFRP